MGFQPLTTPQVISERFEPIGRLIAARIKYKVKELNVVGELQDSDSIVVTGLKLLVRKMTCVNPKERFSAEDVVKFFENYSGWKEVQRIFSVVVIQHETKREVDNDNETTSDVDEEASGTNQYVSDMDEDTFEANKDSVYSGKQVFGDFLYIHVVVFPRLKDNRSL